MNVLRKPQGCRAVWGSSHSQGWISAADGTDTAQSASWGFSGPKLRGPPPGCRDGWKLLHSEGASMLVVLTTPYASALSSFQCLLSCFCPHRWRWQSLYIICSVWVRSVSWFHWKKKKNGVCKMALFSLLLCYDFQEDRRKTLTHKALFALMLRSF